MQLQMRLSGRTWAFLENTGDCISPLRVNCVTLTIKRLKILSAASLKFAKHFKSDLLQLSKSFGQELKRNVVLLIWDLLFCMPVKTSWVWGNLFPKGTHSLGYISHQAEGMDTKLHSLPRRSAVLKTSLKPLQGAIYNLNSILHIVQ